MSTRDPLIGRKLGDYTILSLLGRGGMSRVYQGFDENLQRFAAVKVINADFETTTEEEYTRRFQSEARAIARLRHPNIVGVYQFGRAEGLYYMAQVFLEGTDLRTLLKNYADRHRLMPHEDVLRITRDVASALDYAHEQGVIHRDIKPSNIMLERRTGRAILMDFGLALSIHEGTLGDTFGTAQYIAPEQAVSSARAVRQSDLYSWGVVLYEMLTGRVPFEDESVMSVALKHLNENPPPPTRFNPQLSPEVESLLLRLLDKNPRRRPASGAEMLHDLERALGQTAHPTDGISLELAQPVATRAPDTTPSRPSVSRPSVASSPLAPRFAQRRAEKEEKAALRELAEESLTLDPAALDSLLDTYPDPRDVGLVGPDAKPITTSRHTVDSEGRRIRLQPKRRRRWHPFILLFSIVLLALALAVAWFFFVLENDDNGALEEAAAPAATPIPEAAGIVPEPTPTPPSATRLPATPTPVATAVALAGPLAARLQYDDTQFVLVNTADQPLDASNLVFEQVQDGRTVRSFRASAWAETTGGALGTLAPGACYQIVTAGGSLFGPLPEGCSEISRSVRSLVPYRYFWQSQTPGATFVIRREGDEAPLATCGVEAGVCELGDSAAAAPAATPIPAAQPTAQPANMRLVYRPDQVLLINLSDATLDVRDLVFEQTRPDGSVRRFEASRWDRPGAANSPRSMTPGGCFQLLAGDAQEDPETNICQKVLGWYSSGLAGLYFWQSGDPERTFEVRQSGSDAVIATCPIDAGVCEFYVAPPA